MNKYLFSFLSGLIQGLTEFLPISSSGHLALLHNIFGFSEPHTAFDILLHFGTLSAVLFAYGKDVKRLVSAAFSIIKKLFSRRFKFGPCDADERLCIMLFLSTLPLVAGVFIGERLTSLAIYTKAVGSLLILNAVILLAGDIAARRKSQTSLYETNCKSAIFIGVLQLFATAPGISRSGITVTGGLFAGLSREDAVKYSFLLSLPATFGANILNIKDIVKAESEMPELLPCVFGVVTAALTGFFAIKLIEKISKRTNFGIFAVYCLALGIAAIIFG